MVEQVGRIRYLVNGKIGGTFLDIRDRVTSGGEQGLLSVAFLPGYARTTASTSTTPTRAATRAWSSSVRERQGREVERAPVAVRAPAVREPQRRRAAVRRDGLLYVGMGDGGCGRRPGNRAQSIEREARQAAADQPDCTRRDLADRRARPAQPVAILVRPRQRRPLHRRRRPGSVGGDRLPAARHGSARSRTTAGALRGRCRYSSTPLDPGELVAPVYVYATTGRLFGHRRLRLPWTAVAAAQWAGTSSATTAGGVWSLKSPTAGPLTFAPSRSTSAH